MPRRGGESWTPEEDAVLRRMKDAGLPMETISLALGRTAAACTSRLHEESVRRTGHPRGSLWRGEEDAVLRRMAAAGRTWTEIAERLPGRSARGCASRAASLGIVRPKKPAEEVPVEQLSRRPCHDCGKPTTDYRCPSCLAKWRTKHGVSPSGREDDEYTFGSGWFFCS